MWNVVVWGQPRMECLPEWGCPWKEGNERLPPPIPGVEVSIGYGQKITLQGQYHRRVT